MGTIHTASLTEPMLVFGPSRYRDRTAAYVRRLTFLHLVLTAGMSVALLSGLLVVALMGSPSGSTPALAGLAVSAPAILFLWLMRRACYIETRPRLAATSGLAYALLVSAGMVLLTREDALTAASALMAFGLASLVVAWWLKLRLSRFHRPSVATLSLADVATSHWSYGRWALGSGLFGWVPGNLVLLAMPLWHSLDDVATLRVAMTLIMPVLQAEGALAALLTPALVRARLSGQLRSTAKRALTIFFAFSLLYVPLVIGFGSRLAQWLFGDHYQFDRPTLGLLAATPLFIAISLVSAGTLQALERPDQIFWINAALAVGTCVVGLPFVFVWGVAGALASMLLSAVMGAALATWASLRLTRGARPQEAPTRVPQYIGGLGPGSG